ncbi:NADPH:quinone oxidoreductase family protein [Stappia indica]|uniref:NADPH2:quinone reductase n=1 Tax=Stappia indica TaxID=538381 RepID=A0A285RXM9_9HYPH|nr:NADPH:quinone oxidoreductase family protein [Stappia indica]MCC4244533.1 NADPH:quinone oxidoreductase family protein [Stappia indica]SOB99303.1 NADPH2:quinone reductase [Stappia indica]
MKAVLCERLGAPEDLVLRDIEMPSPGPGELLVEVSAAALNFFDTLIIQGKYQFRPELPFSPGAEFAGRVLETGEGIEAFEPGDRVMGYVRWGAVRGAVIATEDDLVALPDEVSDEAAAGLSVTYGTSLHAFRDRARLEPGETVAVLGASGGVGLAAVEIAKAMGARVIACASSAEKLELARAHGADILVNYAEEDLKARLKQLTDGCGVDVVYDPVGGELAEAALRATGWRGRYLVIGFAAGEIPKLPLNLVMLKGCDVLGVFWGDAIVREPEAHRDNMEQLLAWMREGRIRPHLHAVYPIEETARALRELADRKVQGKVIIRP